MSEMPRYSQNIASILGFFLAHKSTLNKPTNDSSSKYVFNDVSCTITSDNSAHLHLGSEAVAIISSTGELSISERFIAKFDDFYTYFILSTKDFSPPSC